MFPFWVIQDTDVVLSDNNSEHTLTKTLLDI